MKDGGGRTPPSSCACLAPTVSRTSSRSAVIDASGTIETPGALGASGHARDRRSAPPATSIFYGIPDVLGAERSRYAGRRVLVVGSGHSALNALLDLAQLADEEPATRITWAIRRTTIGHLLGGPRQDQLEERGKLGLERARPARRAVAWSSLTGFHID